jgi:hypothetical protein
VENRDGGLALIEHLALVHVLDSLVATPVEALAGIPTPTLVVIGADDERAAWGDVAPGEETLMYSALRAGLDPDQLVNMIVTGIRPALDWPGPPEIPPGSPPEQLTLLEWPREPTAGS